MAQSKLEYFVKGLSTFLSGKMYVTRQDSTDVSWQRKSFVNGYNFAYDLFLSDDLSDKLDLFEVFLKEPLDNTIQKTWLKWNVKIFHKGHVHDIIIPFKSYKQLFLGSYHQINNETTAFKLKVLKGLEDLDFKVLDCTLIKPDDIKL